MTDLHRRRLDELIRSSPVGLHLLDELSSAPERDWASEPFLTLMMAAADAANRVAPPLWFDPPDLILRALRRRSELIELCATLTSRFFDELTAGLDPSRHDWWRCPKPPFDHWNTWPWPDTPGQLPDLEVSTGWWTWPGNALVGVSNALRQMPEEAGGGAFDVDEDHLVWQPLVVDPGARVYVISEPDVWRHLCERYRQVREGPFSTGWELPGSNQDQAHPIFDVPGQAAGRRSMRHFVEPDWNRVREDWDGVHLTWAGMITTEWRVLDGDDGDVMMLRGWGLEETLWLNPAITPVGPTVPERWGWQKRAHLGP